MEKLNKYMYLKVFPSVRFIFILTVLGEIIAFSITYYMR